MDYELNNYLETVVKNNSYCKTCELNHNGICFFAYNCIAKDFAHYMDNGEELEENEITLLD